MIEFMDQSLAPGDRFANETSRNVDGRVVWTRHPNTIQQGDAVQFAACLFRHLPDVCSADFTWTYNQYRRCLVCSEEALINRNVTVEHVERIELDDGDAVDLAELLSEYWSSDQVFEAGHAWRCNKETCNVNQSTKVFRELVGRPPRAMLMQIMRFYQTGVIFSPPPPPNSQSILQSRLDHI